MKSEAQADCPTASLATSQSLLAQLKDRDPDAWDRLVRLYSPLIYHWCRRLNLPQQEMADVFQEVFHAVARGIENFRRDRPGDTFRGWLRTVTRSKVLDYYRRLGRQPQPVGGTDAKIRLDQVAADESGASSSELIDTGERQAHSALFHRALASIRPHFHEQTWQAFWCVAVEGRATRDVATELAMTPGNVRVAKARVLQRLRQELGDSEA